MLRTDFHCSRPIRLEGHAASLERLTGQDLEVQDVWTQCNVYGFRYRAVGFHRDSGWAAIGAADVGVLRSRGVAYWDRDLVARLWGGGLLLRSGPQSDLLHKAEYRIINPACPLQSVSLYRIPP